MNVDLTLLVNRAKQGNSEAFGQLYEIYADQMYRYALWYLGASEPAEDAVSDAVCSAFASVGDLRNPESFKPWLFRILANCCKSYLSDKIRARSHEVPELDESLAQTGSCPHDCVELRLAVQNLNETDRRILLLSVIGGYASAEIGDMLSMPPGTVRSRLSRALEKLRRLLDDRQQIAVCET